MCKKYQYLVFAFLLCGCSNVKPSEVATIPTPSETTTLMATTEVSVEVDITTEVDENTLPLDSLWFDENGIFRIPEEYYEFEGEVEELSKLLTVPDEDLKRASTIDLLNSLSRAYEMTWIYPQLFNSPSEYLNILKCRTNIYSEIANRDDLSDFLLDHYKGLSYLKKADGLDIGDGMNAESSIIIDELLMADNAFFEKLSPEEYTLYLDAIKEKNKEKISKDNIATKCYYFTAYILEQYKNGDGKWVEYIMNDNTQAKYKKMIDPLEPTYWWITVGF